METTDSVCRAVERLAEAARAAAEELRNIRMVRPPASAGDAQAESGRAGAAECTGDGSMDEFIRANATDLHRIYHLMHACWYGTPEHRSGEVPLGMPFSEWAKDWLSTMGPSEQAVRESLSNYAERAAGLGGSGMA